MDIVIIGLTITSSWGNGHATTYRGLAHELARRGHRVQFLEHDKPWYASNRDLHTLGGVTIDLYNSFEDLKDTHASAVASADLVVVGSYVPQGVAVGEWVTTIARGVTAFYDIDTPVTLAKLDRGDEEYISRPLVGRYDLYLSFSGGPLLRKIERCYGARRALPLYCSMDPSLYFPRKLPMRWDLGYLGTYSDDRQPSLQRLLLDVAMARPAYRFVVAGPQYPQTIAWPDNVQRIEHLPPEEHCAFYNSQRFTLNITRADMIAAGYSPSVRLFEAAACATPIISDGWNGLANFLSPGRQVLVVDRAEDVIDLLDNITETQRREIGEAARQRVLAYDTAAHRAAALERYAIEISNSMEQVLQ